MRTPQNSLRDSSNDSSAGVSSVLSGEQIPSAYVKRGGSTRIRSGLPHFGQNIASSGSSCPFSHIRTIGAAASTRAGRPHFGQNIASPGSSCPFSHTRTTGGGVGGSSGRPHFGQ